MTDDRAKLPVWTSRPFHAFYETMDTLLDVLHVSVQGVRLVSAMPNVLEVLVKTSVDDVKRADDEKRLENAKREATLAKREVETEFQLLHAQAVMFVWSALETLMKDLLVCWLENEHSAWDRDAVARIRVPVSTFQRLTSEERARFVVETLERDAGAALKQGAGRFEAVLSGFGISLVLSDKDRKAVFELSQVRHCVAHRSGVADQRLVEACPWLGVTVGERIRISHDDFHRYHHAALHIAAALTASCYELLGLGTMAELLGPLVSKSETPQA